MGLAKYAEDNWEIYNERMKSREWYTFDYSNNGYQKTITLLKIKKTVI